MPTSPTGIEPSTRRQRPARAQGFTLIEVIISLVIIALLSAVMAPNLISTPNTRLRAAGAELVAGMRDTRLQALRTRSPQALLITVDPPSYQVPGAAARQLDEDLQLQLTLAESDILDEGQGALSFFPDGSSKGGRISLGNGGLIQHIDVEWLTGRVRVLEE